jgi:hypothetical protein
MAKSVCKATKILNLDFVNSDNSLLTINQQDLIASALNLSRYEQEDLPVNRNVIKPNYFSLFSQLCRF